MSEVNAQDGIRELTLAELDEIVGGFLDFEVEALAVGIGQVNQGSVSLGNLNIGIVQVDF